MIVEALDHVNLRTPDVTGTAAFFAELLELQVQPSPGTDDPEKALWICDGAGRAIIHLARPDIAYPWEPEAGVPAVAPGSGRVHHVALRCVGYDGLRERLVQRGTAFHANDIPQVSLRQLFVSDPNGVLLELNFFAN